MTTTAPEGSTAGSPAPPHPAPTRPRRRRRWVVAGVLAILALVGFTVRAFASEGGFTASRIGRAADCGEFEQCVPGLPAGDVAGMLASAGHTCERDEAVGHVCTLEIGFTTYEMWMRSPDGDDGIVALRGEIFRPDEEQAGGFPAGAPPPAGTIPYLAWIAAVPYGNDAAGSREITTWLRRQIESGESAEIQFGDYRYEVTYERAGNISLTVHAERPFR